MNGYSHGDDGSELGLDEGPPPRMPARTISVKRGRRPLPADYPKGAKRPKTRGDCKDGVRPCPWCGVLTNMKVVTRDEIDRPVRTEVRKTGGVAEGGRGPVRGADGADVARPVRLRDGEGRAGGKSSDGPVDHLRVRAETSRQVRDAGTQCMVLNDSEVHEPENGQIPPLRRARDSGLSALEGERESLLGRHGSASERRAQPRQNRLERQLRTEQLPLGHPQGPKPQSPHCACPDCGGAVSHDRGVGGNHWSWIHYDPREDQAGMVAGASRCRPCRWSGCRHHLYLDVHPKFGGIKLNFPHLAVQEMDPSCALDVADRGGSLLEEVGNAMNITRERVRQIEQVALDRVLNRLSPQLRRELRAYIKEVA